ncbi:alpha/beta fold hydrolase [Falsiroseomonas oryzae]|uniref:alpha/beta fold hydrolase n=1 Tax=Falsiroseomonas oryzae TaxID=2766473 RepID=UPI0022EAE49F|nr:alpha/beta hydrolase [Roseomonas sp. MO-31]
MHTSAFTARDAALASAMVLAGAALQSAADARRAERENPPRGRFVQAGGVRLHYLQAGPADAPPVVLLHGNAVTAEDFVASGIFGRLARHHRVIAFDRPGYGYSARPRDRLWTAETQAAVLAEAFDRLGARRSVVVGHSWGALVAVALGLDHPAAVSGLVLLAGYHYPTARADVAVFSPPALPVLGDALRYTVGPLAGRLIAPGMIRQMFAPRPVPPAFTAAVPVPMMLRPWQIKASAEDAAFMTPRTARAAPRYGELARLPVAILAGAEDRIVDVGRHSVRLHRAVPGSTLRILPGLGHMLHHGAPGIVTAAVEGLGTLAHAA